MKSNAYSSNDNQPPPLHLNSQSEQQLTDNTFVVEQNGNQARNQKIQFSIYARRRNVFGSNKKF